MASLVDVVKMTSVEVENGRTEQDVLAYLMAEVGELAEEVMIASGKSYKQPGKDGIVGESVDVIVCALDMIHVNNPELTEEEIVAIAVEKCRKWMHNSKTK